MSPRAAVRAYNVYRQLDLDEDGVEAVVSKFLRVRRWLRAHPCLALCIGSVAWTAPLEVVVIVEMRDLVRMSRLVSRELPEGVTVSTSTATFRGPSYMEVPWFGRFMW